MDGFTKMPEQSLRNEVKKEFTAFIQDFRDAEGNQKYVLGARNAIVNSRHHLVFHFLDLMHHNQELANLIFNEYYKYEPIINDSLTQYMLEEEKNLIHNDNRREDEIRERYECSFDNGLEVETDLSVRGLKCNLLGRLIKLKGTVTRTSEVRPELKVGVFKCRNCGKLSKEIVQQFKYTEPKRCNSDNCDKSSWELEMGKCTFVDFQKIRVQEDPTQIPPGAMPRSIDVILRN